MKKWFWSVPIYIMLSTNEDIIPRPCAIQMKQHRLIISAFVLFLEILQNKPMLTAEHQTFTQRVLPTYKDECTVTIQPVKLMLQTSSICTTYTDQQHTRHTDQQHTRHTNQQHTRHTDQHHTRHTDQQYTRHTDQQYTQRDKFVNHSARAWNSFLY
jgi:hypothetical protein